MTTLPEAVVAAAGHCRYCPKLCRFACPVATATGREDATPWGLHTTVADLASGRLTAVAAAPTLSRCTGCGACREPCLPGLDPPAAVRAGRAHVHAAGGSLPAVAAAIAAVAAGRSPYGTQHVESDRSVPEASVVVVPGCADPPEDVEALAALLTVARETVAVVPPAGCCGALLDDLGATDAALAARERLAQPLAGAMRVVVTDPHCLDTVASATSAAVELASDVLAQAVNEGRLRLSAAGAHTVAVHDACHVDGGPVRGLLAAAGVQVVDRADADPTIPCSGAGMGFDLLDPEGAALVARRTARMLEGGGHPVMSVCARARRALAETGAPTVSLVTVLRGAADP